jgi:hypothetical protein
MIHLETEQTIVSSTAGRRGSIAGELGIRASAAIVGCSDAGAHPAYRRVLPLC